MRLSHHAYTLTTYQRHAPMEHLKTTHVYMSVLVLPFRWWWQITVATLAVTADTGRTTACKWQLSSTRSFVHVVFDSAVRFMMMHVYALFYIVSNHFHNTHNPHLLSTLTSAGLKSTESCIMAVVKVRCLGSYCTHHKFYIIIFMIFTSPYLGNYTREQLQIFLRSQD